LGTGKRRRSRHPLWGGIRRDKSSPKAADSKRRECSAGSTTADVGMGAWMHTHARHSQHHGVRSVLIAAINKLYIADAHCASPWQAVMGEDVDRGAEQLVPGNYLAFVDRLRMQTLHTPQVQHFAVELLAGTSPRVKQCAPCACCQHENRTNVVEIVPASEGRTRLGKGRALSHSPTHHSVNIHILKTSATQAAVTESVCAATHSGHSNGCESSSRRKLCQKGTSETPCGAMAVMKGADGRAVWLSPPQPRAC